MEISKEVKPQIKKGLWKPEEDLLLKNYVETHGEGNWATVSERSGLMRGGKSCRLRWKNYLRPNIKRGRMSEEEEDLIIRMHKLLGNRWSLIAGRIPGRTDNEVKNYWNTHLNKRCPRGKRKSANSDNNDDDADDNGNKKKLRRLPESRLICSSSLKNTTQGSDGRKEEEESTITNPWMEDTKGFNYDMLPVNNATFFFDDHDPFMPFFDSFVLLEAFGGGFEETYYSQEGMQPVMP